MNIPVTEAKSLLTELVRRAEAGEEVVLTRHGHPTVKLVPVKKELTAEERDALIKEIRASAARNLKPGPSAARSADFLYDKDGLPK